jgi:hypothetical protein
MTAAAMSVLAAVAVSAWALCVLPFAVIIGICACNGLTLAQTWAGMAAAAEEDPGRGPAGLGF